MLRKLSSAGINLGVLVISIVIFVGAFIALSGLANANKPPTLTILVAAHDLSVGEVITPDDLLEKTVYQDDNAALYIPADQAGEVAGGVAALPVFAGQPLFRTSLLAPAAIPYRLSAILSQYPGYSLVPLPLDASNVIAPDVSLFLPGDVVGVTMVVATRPQPPSTPSAFGFLTVPQPTATAEDPVAPVEAQKESAEDRSAPPLAKDLFPTGVMVVMVQGAPVNTVDDLSEDSAGDTSSPSTTMFTDFTTQAMLILLVPNNLREELSLALQQGDQLVVSLMARGDELTTPGFTYWDFEELFKADRKEALRLESPVTNPAIATPTPTLHPTEASIP